MALCSPSTACVGGESPAQPGGSPCSTGKNVLGLALSAMHIATQDTLEEQDVYSAPCALLYGRKVIWPNAVKYAEKALYSATALAMPTTSTTAVGIRISNACGYEPQAGRSGCEFAPAVCVRARCKKHPKTLSKLIDRSFLWKDEVPGYTFRLKS